MSSYAGLTFELTPELLLLLNNSYVSDQLSDCEYGAAEIDPKRPYGNSDVEHDIAELLGWVKDPNQELTSEQSAEAKALHEQTPIALSIVLQSLSFEPGVFERKSEYSNRWTRVL